MKHNIPPNGTKQAPPRRKQSVSPSIVPIGECRLASAGWRVPVARYGAREIASIAHGYPNP